VTTVTDSSCISDDTSTLDINLINNVCNVYGIDVDMLYVQAASRQDAVSRAKSDANKEKHLRWKPPKQSSLPTSDVHCMITNKAEIDINGAMYSIKKASSAPEHSNVTIDGITYSVSKALTTYHVSAS